MVKIKHKIMNIAIFDLLQIKIVLSDQSLPTAYSLLRTRETPLCASAPLREISIFSDFALPARSALNHGPS